MQQSYPDLDFDIVDVFADRPFTGNQLAVVHGAQHLTRAQCQAVAVEFGFSETVFPVPVDERTYDARIFTPATEIPFAGHPTLGAAWTLRERGRLSPDGGTQRCGAGEVPVRFGDPLVELTATPRDLLGPVDHGLAVSLLADVGLGADDLAGEVWLAGTGLTFAHVPVRPGALERARPSVRPLAEYVDGPAATGRLQDPLEGIDVHVTGEVSDGSHGATVAVRSRVFVPGLSVPEDPATGSAAAGLGLALAVSGVLPDGGGYTVTQGVEMGRPSSLTCRLDAEAGRVRAVHVAGQVQPVATGRIRVPVS